MDIKTFHEWLSDERRGALVMGVLNVTPDSFSDGGRFYAADAAVAQGQRMAEEGADLIDIGGESTRPGAEPVPAEEQIRRIVPVIQKLTKEPGVAISVDTSSAAVARAALDAGAGIVNDISAGRDDPGLLPLAAQRGAAVILMHMLGRPSTMQANPAYGNVTREVVRFLRERLGEAVSAGMDAGRVLLDPGIGFGKTAEHNLQLLRDLRELRAIGRPLVIGTSRKSFIGKVLNQPDPSQRLMGTAATVAWSVANGADIVRVHDVREMAQVVKLIAAIARGRP